MPTFFSQLAPGDFFHEADHHGEPSPYVAQKIGEASASFSGLTIHVEEPKALRVVPWNPMYFI